MEITIYLNLKQDIIYQSQALTIIIDSFNIHESIRRIKLSNLILQCCYLASKKVTRIGDISAKVQRTNISIYLKDETFLLHGYILLDELKLADVSSYFQEMQKSIYVKTIDLLLSYLSCQKLLEESSANKSTIGANQNFQLFCCLKESHNSQFPVAVNSHPEM